MSRAKWKNPFIYSNLFSQILHHTEFKTSPFTYIQTKSKNSEIMPFLVGLTLQIYNGKKYIKLKITNEMVGYKIGEFIPTRTKRFDNKKKK